MESNAPNLLAIIVSIELKTASQKEATFAVGPCPQYHESWCHIMIINKKDRVWGMALTHFS